MANGEETISGIRDALRLEKGLSGGNLQRRIEYLSSDPPFLTVNQDWVKFEKESFAGILMELIEGLGLRDKFIPPHKKDEEIQEKVRRELERKVLVASTIEVGHVSRIKVLRKRQRLQRLRFLPLRWLIYQRIVIQR